MFKNLIKRNSKIIKNRNTFTIIRNFKRSIVPEDHDHKLFLTKFNNKKSEKIIKNSRGKELYYPKYGNSHYESQKYKDLFINKNESDKKED